MADKSVVAFAQALKGGTRPHHARVVSYISKEPKNKKPLFVEKDTLRKEKQKEIVVSKKQTLLNSKVLVWLR